MWNYFDVQYLDDGEGFGLPHVLKAVQPEAKFIISLRDPIERYSFNVQFNSEFIPI